VSWPGTSITTAYAANERTHTRLLNHLIAKIIQSKLPPRCPERGHLLTPQDDDARTGATSTSPEIASRTQPGVPDQRVTKTTSGTAIIGNHRSVPSGTGAQPHQNPNGPLEDEKHLPPS
jgi:hypothetical protein